MSVHRGSHEHRAHGSEHLPSSLERRPRGGQPDAGADYCPGGSRGRARQREGARQAPAGHTSAYVS